MENGLSQVIALIVFDDEGKRLACKYSSLASSFKKFEDDNNRKAFERELLNKAASQRLKKSQQIEILTHQDITALYRSCGEIQMLVIGDPRENEILLADVLSAMYQCIVTITAAPLGATLSSSTFGGGQSGSSTATGQPGSSTNLAHQQAAAEAVTRKAVMDKLDAVFMVLDEIVDDSIIFELDPVLICERIETSAFSSSKALLAAQNAAQPNAPGEQISTARVAQSFNQAFAQARDSLIRSLLSG